MAQHTCLTCGNPFVSNSRKRKFCSHACYTKNIQRGEQKTCGHCGKSYVSTGDRNLHYCSRECYSAAHDIPSLQYTCLCCNKTFERVARKDRPPKYCSQECRDGHLKPTHAPPLPLKTHVCENCGAEFQGKRHIKRKYCSKACNDAGRTGKQFDIENRRSETRHCLQCGESFVEFLSQPRKFCCAPCYQQWQSENLSGKDSYFWQGGAVGDRGHNWDEQAAKARQRDGYCCQHCGVTEDDLNKTLDVHHLIPFRRFGLERYLEANVLSNLLTLCRKCHTAAERAIRRTE